MSDVHTWVIEVEGIVCEEIYDPVECVDAGCYWYNDSCHADPPSCEDYPYQEECVFAGCFWYNGSCHTNPPECSMLLDPIECDAYG